MGVTDDIHVTRFLGIHSTPVRPPNTAYGCPYVWYGLSRPTHLIVLHQKRNFILFFFSGLTAVMSGPQLPFPSARCLLCYSRRYRFVPAPIPGSIHVFLLFIPFANRPWYREIYRFSPVSGLSLRRDPDLTTSCPLSGKATIHHHLGLDTSPHFNSFDSNASHRFPLPCRILSTCLVHNRKHTSSTSHTLQIIHTTVAHFWIHGAIFRLNFHSYRTVVLLSNPFLNPISVHPFPLDPKSPISFIGHCISDAPRGVIYFY